MRDYLDNGESVAQKNGRDTEITLNLGAQMAIFLGLALLCGLCFGLGYTVGHHSSRPGAASKGPTPAPDQEPLQASGMIPKPSAKAQAPVTQPAADSAAADGSANPQQAGQVGDAAQGQVRPALAGNTPDTQAAGAQNVHPALPAAAAQLMVQVAAVSHGEDADVLVTALRRRGYPVSERREPGDGLIHVRVGPFASREEANRWRDKLLGDGYNAMIQP